MTDILLHSCCAPCSAAILEWLLANDFSPTLFYYNPNIYPKKEYEIRKTEITKYAQKLNIPIVDGDYEHKLWREKIKGFESEPERGKRCSLCFYHRLLATAQKAQELHISLITTTLSSSRWKNLEQIGEAGKRAAAQTEGVKFWDKNWRKDGLQQRRNELLKENEFYNQNYCGCEFSIGKNANFAQ